MIGHKGIAGCEEHDETEQRADGDCLKRERDFNTASSITPGKVNRRAYSNGRNQPSIGKRIGGNNVPARVNEGQFRRPDQFAGVKPKGVARNKKSLWPTEVELSSRCALMCAFP